MKKKHPPALNGVSLELKRRREKIEERKIPVLF